MENLLLFSERLALQKLYEQWVEKIGMPCDNIPAFIIWLCDNKLLNIEETRNLIGGNQKWTQQN